MVLRIFIRIQSALSQVIKADDGQGLTEYSLVIALIGVVAITALHFTGSGVTRALTSVATSL
jgi:Flp pilus assembly pilin Flp